MTDPLLPSPGDPQPLTRRAAREAAQGTVPADPQLTEPQPAEPQRAEPQSAGADGSRGLGAMLARHPRAWLFSALGVAFMLLGTGSVFAGVAAGSGQAVEKPVAPVTTSSSPSPSEDPPRAVPGTIAAATHLRTCSVAVPAADPRLLTFEGSVINADTGEALFDRAASTPAPAASVLKTLTAAAALATLGPDHQLSTRVMTGSTPDSVVLVGGGDPTVSALPAGVESFYRGAPKYSDLAGQTAARWATLHPGEPITSVVLDASLWDPADSWDPSWERSEQTEGAQPEITALMVDGDRANPKQGTSPRGDDPVATAGKAFVAALADAMGVEPATITVSSGAAPQGAERLAEVKSQPLRVLIGQMLPASDNTLAETLARAVSLSAGKGGSSASLAQVIPAALKSYNLDTTGLVIRDGSGLSANNAVSPAFVTALMAKILAGQQNLNLVYKALPVAGQSGTLTGRFTGAAAIARGQVNAKTGWIKSARTLAGIVHAKDGTKLAFAFYALGPVRSDAMAALDAVTAAVFSCGNNLSNN